MRAIRDERRRRLAEIAGNASPQTDEALTTGDSKNALAAQSANNANRDAGEDQTTSERCRQSDLAYADKEDDLKDASTDQIP